MWVRWVFDKVPCPPVSPGEIRVLKRRQGGQLCAQHTSQYTADWIYPAWWQLQTTLWWKSTGKSHWLQCRTQSQCPQESELMFSTHLRSWGDDTAEESEALHSRDVAMILWIHYGSHNDCVTRILIMAVIMRTVVTWCTSGIRRERHSGTPATCRLIRR